MGEGRREKGGGRKKAVGSKLEVGGQNCEFPYLLIAFLH